MHTDAERKYDAKAAHIRCLINCMNCVQNMRNLLNFTIMCADIIYKITFIVIFVHNFIEVKMGVMLH